MRQYIARELEANDGRDYSERSVHAMSNSPVFSMLHRNELAT